MVYGRQGLSGLGYREMVVGDMVWIVDAGMLWEFRHGGLETGTGDGVW
jgi:hypothetical protein